MRGLAPDREAALRELESQPLAIAPDRLAPFLAAGPEARRPPLAGERRGAVAVLPLFGLLAPHDSFALQVFGGTLLDRFAEQFRALVAAPSVSAIVLDIHSPGGSAYGAEELASLIFDARGKKRVVAVADQLMASAAYWIGAAAEELVVAPSGEAGSIGVYMVHFDFSAALEMEGVKPTIIRAGRNKAEGNPWEPLGKEARSHLQNMADAFEDLFVRSVARGRGVGVARVRESFGQGRTFTAARAVERGMADRVATLEAVVEELRRGGGRPGGRRGAAAELGPGLHSRADEHAGLSWPEALALADETERRRVWRSCLHEAGHTVAHVLEGTGVLSLGLRWSVEGGRFAHEGGWTFADPDGRPMSPAAAAAGYAAVLDWGRFRDWREHAEAHDGAAGDWARIEELHGGHTFDGSNRALREGLWLVRTYRDAVEAVARALEEKGRLSGTEATLLVLGELPEWKRADALRLLPRAS